jgi:cell division septation protein DedD
VVLVAPLFLDERPNPVLAQADGLVGVLQEGEAEGTPPLVATSFLGWVGVSTGAPATGTAPVKRSSGAGGGWKLAGYGWKSIAGAGAFGALTAMGFLLLHSGPEDEGASRAWSTAGAVSGISVEATEPTLQALPREGPAPAVKEEDTEPTSAEVSPAAEQAAPTVAGVLPAAAEHMPAAAEHTPAVAVAPPTAGEVPPSVEETSGRAVAEEEAVFVVHLSSNRVARFARAAVEELRGEGHPAEIWEVDIPGKGHWFRVVAGAFPTRGEAEELAEELRRAARWRDARVVRRQ